MRHLLMLLLLSTSFVFTSFSTPKHAQVYVLDDYPDAITGAITGANTVQVHLNRYGTDAGQGSITFDVDILFNDNVLQTFRFTMENGETSREDYVAGPNPTAFAEVREVRIVSRG